MSSYRYTLKTALCPFYRQSGDKKIYCDALDQEVGIHLVFPRKIEQTEWQQKHCCDDWEHCIMLNIRRD